MNRRSFLSALAALPVVGPLVRSLPQSQSDATADAEEIGYPPNAMKVFAAEDIEVGDVVYFGSDGRVRPLYNRKTGGYAIDSVGESELFLHVGDDVVVPAK